MTTPARVLAAETIVDAAREYTLPGRVRRREIERVLDRPDYALYVFRRARSLTHPQWSGGHRVPWDRVQAAARILGLPETEPLEMDEP